MMTCKACGCKKIKSITNYSHGKKSRGFTSLVCKECGSSNIEQEVKRFFRGRR